MAVPRRGQPRRLRRAPFAGDRPGEDTERRRPGRLVERHDEGHPVRLLALLREGLLGIGALPRASTEGYFADWRALVHRADLTAKELKLLEHMARKMRGAGGNG